MTWQLNESADTGVTITSDDGAFGVGGENKQRLSNYFAHEVYPVLKENLGH